MDMNTLPLFPFLLFLNSQMWGHEKGVVVVVVVVVFGYPPVSVVEDMPRGWGNDMTVVLISFRP